MEKLEELLVDELKGYYCINKDDLQVKKITVTHLTSPINRMVGLIKILVDNFCYKLQFNECRLTKYHIEILNNYLLLNSYQLKFINCVYDCEDCFLNDLYLLDNIYSNGIKINRIGIDLSNISIFSIKYFKLLQYTKFNKISFELADGRYINLKSKDISKILSNRKKFKIGCKAMKLQNWIKFFSQETYTFENERYTHNFKEIEFGFEKFLLLIQS